MLSSTVCVLIIRQLWDIVQWHFGAAVCYLSQPASVCDHCTFFVILSHKVWSYVMLWVIHIQDTSGDPCPYPVPWTTSRRRIWQDGVLTARGDCSSILWPCLCHEEWTFFQPRGRGCSGDPSVCPDAWGRAASTLHSVTCSVLRNILFSI